MFAQASPSINLKSAQASGFSGNETPMNILRIKLKTMSSYLCVIKICRLGSSSMFKQTLGFHGKNIIVERICCENPDGKIFSVGKDLSQLTLSN